MSEKKFVPPGIHIIVVNRGNMQILVPLDEEQMARVNGSGLAWFCAGQFFQLQSRGRPGEADKPINPQSRSTMALQYAKNNEYLRADVMVHLQFEGKWEDLDVPEGLRNEYTGRAPYIELNLVDTPLIRLR